MQAMLAYSDRGVSSARLHAATRQAGAERLALCSIGRAVRGWRELRGQRAARAADKVETGGSADMQEDETPLTRAAFWCGTLADEEAFDELSTAEPGARFVTTEHDCYPSNSRAG